MRDNESSKDAYKGTNMSYTVKISEEQRKIIAAALIVMIGTRVGEDDYEESLVREETQAMIDMLEELPQIEAANPGILHGFAL
jgi:hypothetical protein